MVLRNAVTVVAAALLPVAVLGLPVSSTAFLPNAPLFSLLLVLLLRRLHFDLLRAVLLLLCVLILLLPLLILLTLGLLLRMLLLLFVSLSLLLLLVLLFLLLILLTLGLLLRMLLLLFVSLSLLLVLLFLLLILLTLGLLLRMLLLLFVSLSLLLVLLFLLLILLTLGLLLRMLLLLSGLAGCSCFCGFSCGSCRALAGKLNPKSRNIVVVPKTPIGLIVLPPLPRIRALVIVVIWRASCCRPLILVCKSQLSAVFPAWVCSY